MPATHAEHTADVDAEETLPYAPAKQAVHADAPEVSALYEPVKQAVHTDVPVESALYTPAIHAVHTADVDAVDTLLYMPAVHAVQRDVPVVSAL